MSSRLLRGGDRRRRPGCARPAAIEARPERWSCSRRVLDARDWVALEVTGNAWEIARILEAARRAGDRRLASDTGIRQARAKTDRLDAGRLAKLLWAGELDGVWTPDERFARCVAGSRAGAQLVRARGAREERDPRGVDALPEGSPAGVGPVRVKGAGWLAEQQLAVCERETVDAGLRQVDFLDAEIAAVERLIAAERLSGRRSSG
jgi:hypothetical protein